MKIEMAGSGDFEAVRRLVSRVGLPLDGLGSHDATLVFVARDDGRIVGTAALESHGGDGLLRSVAVEPSARGTGVGSALTEAALDAARGAGLGTVYLLTETAERFFAERGFDTMARDAAPSAVAASVEWAEACGESAVAMRLRVPVSR